MTLTPLAADTWIAACAGCPHRSLARAMKFDGKMELFAGGTLGVTDDTSHEQRSATGLWHLRSRADGLDVVLTIPSERYVAAVLNAEAAADEPEESLKALAIVARTYALNGEHFPRTPAHLPAELCDNTQCQAMRLGPVSGSIEKAVRTTAGETLWFRSRRAEVFFSEHCGGTTESATAVWPRLPALPYLVSHPDPYCVRRGSSAWHAEISLSDLASIATAQGWYLPKSPIAVRITDRTASHRVREIAFTDAGGQFARVNAAALRLAIGRALGWNRIRSDQYDVGVRNQKLIFDGRGYGHGAGLCQTGAAEMAAEQRSARDILNFYFPGTDVRIGPTDNGWVTAHTPSLTLRSVQILSTEPQLEMQQVWAAAQHRASVTSALHPEVVVAPSTELFRQMTSQPGWTLASTRGSEIVLQPYSIFHRAGDDPQKTLLHEMLHVLIESEAKETTPLWFREGLVEELAGDAFPGASMTTAADINVALMHATSLNTSRSAHRAAAARVHSLVQRYGMPAVRSWVSSGVPQGIE